MASLANHEIVAKTEISPVVQERVAINNTNQIERRAEQAESSENGG